nr:hypothetical protein [uncultured Vibrio sp.]
MFVFSLVLLWGINEFIENGPMLINFIRVCSVIVAASIIGYMIYSFKRSKTSNEVEQTS